MIFPGSFLKAIYYINIGVEAGEWCQYNTHQYLKLSCMFIYFYKIYFLITLVNQMTVENLSIIITATFLMKDWCLKNYLLN